MFLISCLVSHSDGTHSLKMIHWWTRHAMLHFFRYVPILDGLSVKNIQEISFLGELSATVILQHPSASTSFGWQLNRPHVQSHNFVNNKSLSGPCFGKGVSLKELFQIGWVLGQSKHLLVHDAVLYVYIYIYIHLHFLLHFSHLSEALIQRDLQMRTTEAIKTNKRATTCKCNDKSRLA